ncbi:MAG: SMI1/KNR4 family protein [Butyricicoccus sp.]|nr:SMI1/KNR4 family protein [Butyricicoccus pullicaecorum]
MREQEYAAYLRDLVQKASLADPERKVFGADTHQYELNPVLSLEEVQAYQEKYHVVLPSEYVFLITQVGNGGAGPYYGIYPLDLKRSRHENMGVPFITSHLTQQQWTGKLMPISRENEDLDDCPDDLYEQIESEVLQGVYPVSTQGCSYETMVAAQGDEENRVFYVDMDWNYENKPYDTKMTFLKWYEDFFLEIIAGNRMDSYGTRIIKTEQELMDTFAQTEDLEERRTILNSFVRFLTPKPESIRFFQDLPEDTLADYKMALLLLYDTENGLRLFSHLLQTNPEAALAHSMLVPKERLPEYYETMLHLLYTIENGSEKKYRYVSLHDILLYRLRECPQLRAKDIIMFLEKNSLTEGDIKTALDTLKYVPDRLEAVDTLAHFMRNGSYWVAHTALQAVSRTPCRRLEPVYLEMWERYHADTYMASNLKIAFQTNGIPLPKR